MPAAAKLLADNKLTAGAVAGTGKDGRVTKGDVLGAVAAGAKPRSPRRSPSPTGAPKAALPQVGRARRARRTWASARSSACR